MDIEHSMKRLAVVVGVSLVIIFVAKFLLSKAITQVGNAAAEKRQQAAAARVVQPPSAASAPEAQQAAAAVPASAASVAPASAVEGVAAVR